MASFLIGIKKVHHLYLGENWIELFFKLNFLQKCPNKILACRLSQPLHLGNSLRLLQDKESTMNYPLSIY